MSAKLPLVVRHVLVIVLSPFLLLQGMRLAFRDRKPDEDTLGCIMIGILCMQYNSNLFLKGKTDLSLSLREKNDTQT